MSKAILLFDLPDEKIDFDAASKGRAFALAFWELDQKLRSWGKYGHDFKDADEVIDKTRDELRTILFDHNICLDEYI